MFLRDNILDFCKLKCANQNQKYPTNGEGMFLYRTQKYYFIFIFMCPFVRYVNCYRCDPSYMTMKNYPLKTRDAPIALLPSPWASGTPV